MTSRKTAQTLGVPNRGRLRSYAVSLLSGVAEIDRDRSLLWDKGKALRVISAHSRDLPSLFLAGSKDGVITGLIGAKRVADMERILTDLKAKIILDGAGHWVQQERPDEVNAALIDFLK